MATLISAVSWVQRGVAQRHPSKYKLDEEEIERVAELSRINKEDVRKEMERAQEAVATAGGPADADDDDREAKGEDDESAWVDEDDAMDQDDPSAKGEEDQDELAKYNLDDYDKESHSIAAGPFSNLKGLAYYKDDEEDPYVTLKEDEESLEREELEILPSDNLLVIAKTEDEISQLEVYVYDDSEENLYVHHDLMLPSFPLCLEWLDFPPHRASSSQSTMDTDEKPTPATAQFGNYVAVGTMDPEIEIWSLDTVDALYPDSILGRPDETKAHVPTPVGTGKKKRKKMKARRVVPEHHVDAVLSLSWNRQHRNFLASASADTTVKLWDLSRDPTANGEGSGALRSYEMHKDKVQSVQWNGKNPVTLLTGSYDGTVRTFDTRTPDEGFVARIASDVEAVRWDPWDEHSFYVSLENGLVLNFDDRTVPSSPGLPAPARFTLSAHTGAASALDVNPHIPGCIVTGGTDKLVKVWNINPATSNNGKMDVSLVISRDLGVGKIFAASFSPDDPLTVAAAGSKAKLQLWDVGANAGARKVLLPKLKQAGKDIKEKSGDGVVGVADDGESDEDEEDG